MLDGFEDSDDRVMIRTVTQATRARFEGLHVGQASFAFVQSGSKRVICDGLDVVAEEGDLIVMPAGVVVTAENRPFFDRRYREMVVTFPDEIVAEVFSGSAGRVQHLSHEAHRPGCLLPLLTATLYNCELPRAIRRHRMLEPLVWLREAGFDLSPCAVGSLASDDLERGLMLLQTTEREVIDVALACGFGTTGSFEEAFEDRFGLRPDDIRVARTVPSCSRRSLTQDNLGLMRFG